MLHTKTVADGTYALLKDLMAFDSLGDFALAGGTSLSLQIGHRISYDLDFFGNTQIDLSTLRQDVEASYPFSVYTSSKNILIGDIRGVKVDFVRYKYPLLSPIIEKDGIRLVSQKDISAMKLAAITGRGKRRDFIDLYFLLGTFSLEEMLGFYKQKYDDGVEMLVLKSLIYFRDADEDEMPRTFQPITWEKVKNRIQKEFDQYIKKY